MTKRTSILIIMTLAVGLVPATGFAQLAQSTFNSGTEDWVSVILPYPSAIPHNVVASFTPTWEAAGGAFILHTGAQDSLRALRKLGLL